MKRRWKVMAAGALVACAACDLPTGMPKWDQLWVVPGQDVSVGVDQLLPAGVTLTPDSSAFVVSVAGNAASFTLGSFCSQCAALDGLMAPKPAFDSTITTVERMPADLVSATASGGQLSLTVQHQFAFDPLRPAPSDTTGQAYGYMTIVMRSAGRMVAMDSIYGGDTDGALPAGTPRNFVLPITPGAIGDSLLVQVHINSPAGDPTLINTSEGLDAALNPGTVDISQAKVAVSDVPADGTPTTINVSGLPSFVVDHVQSGALRFNVDNPFNVSGTFMLTMTTPSGVSINKALTITPGTTTPRIAFTDSEMTSLLQDSSIVITTSGNLNATGGTATLTPTQVMTLKTNLEISDLVGGKVNQ